MSANPPGESAIIVPVQLPIAVRRLYDRLNPNAVRGVPAHVTLLYPFMPPSELSDEVRRRVSAVLLAEPAFPVVLGRMQRWPEVVWLAPEPDAPFRRLIAALHAEFPDYPPYGGMHSDVVPHVTIAEGRRPDWLAAAERALPSMLPIRDVCREATVIAQAGDAAPWTTAWRLPLGAAR